MHLSLRPRWRKVYRDIWLHKPRAILVVLAIVVGIVGAGSVLNTWGLIRTATREEYRASNPPSAVLRTDAIDAALLARVRARTDIAYAEARRTVGASVRVGGVSQRALLFALAEPAQLRIGVVESVRGAWPADDGGIVVEHSSVDIAGVDLGSLVTVQVDSGPERALRVTGVSRDVGLAPGWMEHIDYGIVTPATLTALGLPPTFNELRIVVRNPALSRDAVRRIAFDIKADMERHGHPVRDVDVPVPGQHIHAGQIESLLFTQGAFGVLALLLSGFLVVNLISAMLTGQVREIGIMKAIGASGGQIAQMYLGLALVLGLIASAIALPLGALIGHAYAQFTADLLNFSVVGISIPWRMFALQLVVGALLPVCAAAIPVRRGCRIAVNDALRDVGIDPRADDGAGLLLRRARGVSRPLLLSLRNAFRRRQRMVLTLLTLATGGAVYLGARNLRRSIVGSVDLLFSSQRYDFSLRFVRPIDADSLEAAITVVSGVERAEAWSTARAEVAHADSTNGNAFAIVAPPSGSVLFVPTLVSGRVLQAGDTHGLLVNSRLVADEPSLRPGAAVSLLVAGRRSSWTVVGVVETGPTASAYTSRASLALTTSGGRTDVAMVRSRLRGAGAQRELVQRLRSDLSAAGFDVRSSQLVQENRVVIEDHLLMVAGFLAAMSQLMIVVGGLGLAATMSLSVLERTREIGVMRAIGAQHGAIMLMVYVEGLVIALASWVVAIPLSVPMSVLLARAFARIMIPVPIIWFPTVGSIGVWLALVIGVCVVSCTWPARRALAVTTARALQYE